jgi:hypothetical protein
LNQAVAASAVGPRLFRWTQSLPLPVGLLLIKITVWALYEFITSDLYICNRKLQNNFANSPKCHLYYMVTVLSHGPRKFFVKRGTAYINSINHLKLFTQEEWINASVFW